MIDIKVATMQISTNELRVVIDVDKTLVSDIKTTPSQDTIELNYYDQKVWVERIDKHIDLLKSYKARGYEVTVHSANGYRWAHEVVKKLELTPYVDRVETKPSKYVDDKDANTWMQRVYID